MHIVPTKALPLLARLCGAGLGRAPVLQADDGSRRLIGTLELQVAALAGQKVTLMSQVAALQQQAQLLDMKLEAATDQVIEMRRWKTETLAHQGNL